MAHAGNGESNRTMFLFIKAHRILLIEPYSIFVVFPGLTRIYDHEGFSHAYFSFFTQEQA